MMKQSIASSVSFLHELSQLLHLARPKYTLYNHHSGLYLCRVDFAQCTFRTTTPKYHRNDIKNDAARIVLDFFRNLSTVPHQETAHMTGTMPQIPIMTPNKKYVSLLLELCQMKCWEVPDFSFERQVLNGRFICNIRIMMHGSLFCYNGFEAFRKKDAKDHSAKAVFEHLTNSLWFFFQCMI